jgi:hypothetical protein
MSSRGTKDIGGTISQPCCETCHDPGEGAFSPPPTSFSVEPRTYRGREAVPSEVLTSHDEQLIGYANRRDGGWRWTSRGVR